MTDTDRTAALEALSRIKDRCPNYELMGSGQNKVNDFLAVEAALSAQANAVGVDDDDISVIMEFTQQNKADVDRFLGAAKMCGYGFMRLPQPPKETKP